MKARRRDTSIDRRACHLLQYHARLLRDAARNRAFYRALARHVTPRSSVLDIGSGTGVWAIGAARLGARRVVAVEREALLVPLIRRLARENGVGDRVEAIRGDSRRLTGLGRFDVVVSETIGNQAFDEDILPILTDARERFLARGGTLIPREVSLVACPVGLPDPGPRLPAAMGFGARSLASLLVNAPSFLAPGVRPRPAARPHLLHRADLLALPARSVPSRLAATWRLDSARPVNAFVTWSEAVLAEGIRLKTFGEGSHWDCFVYPIRPLRSRRGVVRFELHRSGGIHTWTVAMEGDRGREQAAYSQAFAGAALRRVGDRP